MMPKSLDFNGFQLIFIDFEWIWMDLDLGLDGFVSQLGLLCGAALPGACFFRKNTSLVFLQPKSMVFAL